ncbi:hypothetical protein [Paraburkholderia sp. MM6662-R1]|uniref:hypothetical protein n=1 Tax=Paraburkholderia sp. MM6662-R1 TaxID=2991066 RepID=UPI003D1CB9FB
MIQKLRDTLANVQKSVGADFSGIGIVVCDAVEDLPIHPLRTVSTILDAGDLVAQLSSVSSRHSTFHDGFHIVSTDWKLIKVAQYFSPPIVVKAEINWGRQFGGRYLAALFGSALPSVKATGVASNGFGLAIFQDGKEMYFKGVQ